MSEKKNPGSPNAAEAASGSLAHEAALPRLHQELQARFESLERENLALSSALHNEQAKALLLNHKLRSMQAGVDGMLLAPFQYVRGLYRKLGKCYRLHLVPIHQLKQEGPGRWRSTGDDPQFLMAGDIRWQRLHGWYQLDLVMGAPKDLDARFFFDFDGGRGFSQRHSVSVRLPAKGAVSIPFFVPENCRAVRFDPCQHEAVFGLEVKGFYRKPSMPEVSIGAGQDAMLRGWELLGGTGGNWGSMTVKSAIDPASGEFRWRSKSADPWFQLQLPHPVKAGWYRVELSMRSMIRRGVAKLYMNFGAGYSEADSAALPYLSGERLSRVVYFSDNASAIRFDPLERVSDFSVQHLGGTPVSSEEARTAMLAKLTEHEDFDGKTPGVIWEALKASAAQQGQDPLAHCYEIYQRLHATGQEFPNYADWVDRNEGQWFNAETVRRQREAFVFLPLISVVMPTYNTPIALLREAIDSVRNQSYENWQLCIADDNSPDGAVKEELQRYAQLDPRIRIVLREENGHISAASNSALAVAEGEFVALLDHDDLLAEHALHYVVHYLQANRDAKIIYSDEDKIDVKGIRFDPHFKSDWNPDLFFAQNYVSHLGVYRRDVVAQAGGFRQGVEGSQDHDLLLRCLPFVKADEIVHVPLVLYHWRAVAGSTAQAGEHKAYTVSAGIRALQDFVDAQGMKGVEVAAGLAPNTYRLCHPIPEPAPLVSLLIPTRDRVELVQTCVTSILEKTDYRNFEIIILDNESVLPETLEYFETIQKEQPAVKVLPYHHPFNYSAINNFGARHANGEILGLINNDIEVINAGWLTEMVGQVLRPDIGCVGAKLYFSDDTIQHAGVIVGLGGVAGHSHKYFPRDASGYFHRLKIVQNLSAVTAACLLVRKSVYMEVDGLEEEALKVAFNDVDFCLKVRRAGYRNLWTPYAELYHHESKSRGKEDTPEKIARFASEVAYMQEKWGKDLRVDPFYSANLTLDREDFSLS